MSRDRTWGGELSDAKIAKETGISEHKVVELREEFYAPLGEPDELRAIREELVTVRSTLQALGTAKEAGEQEIARIARKFDALCVRNGWPVS